MQNKKTHAIICPVSIEYKLELEPHKTHKHDGAVTSGRKIYFRNGRALVDEETFERLRQMPEWGIEFMEEAAGAAVPAEPVRPTVKTIESDRDRNNNQTAQIENLTRTVNLLSEAVGQMVENSKKKK